MGEYETVAEGIYQVGGSDLSDPYDAAVYIITCGADLVMIDCGAGRAPKAIIDNIKDTGLDPAQDHYAGADPLSCRPYRINDILQRNISVKSCCP